MALKSYLIDDSLLRMYMSPKHEVRKAKSTAKKAQRSNQTSHQTQWCPHPPSLWQNSR